MAPNNNQAPTVNYNTALAEYGSVYDPQVQQIQAQQAQALQTKNTALDQLSQDNTTKLSQLDQAKVNAFSTNSLNSNARGLFYSGYAPAQNTAYTNNVYNPNVQAQNTAYQRNVDDTNNTYNQNNQTLQQKIADLNQARANDAYSLVQSTKSAYASAAKSSASASKAAAKAAAPTANQIANQIRASLAQATGRNGKVSPEDYADAYIDWINNGQSASSFDDQFKNFKDSTNGYYNYAITQAIKRSK